MDGGLDLNNLQYAGQPPVQELNDPALYYNVNDEYNEYEMDHIHKRRRAGNVFTRRILPFLLILLLLF